MTEQIEDTFRGDIFPDISKARIAKPLTQLVSNLIKEDKELYEIAQQEKEKKRKQYKNDFNSFHISQKVAVERGNKNSCTDKHQFGEISDQQSRNRTKLETKQKLPQSKLIRPYGKAKKQTALPKTRSASAINCKGRAIKPESLVKTEFNQGGQGLVSRDLHHVTPIKPSNFESKANHNYQKFIQAQAGKRNTAVGDRAIVFSANGVPHYGDSWLDKSLQENLSANQATSTPVVTAIPKNIKMAKPIDASKLKRSPNGQIHPKSDTVGNLLAIGGIAAAVTAIMFAIQYVIHLVGFIMHIQQLTATVTNIAQSFLAIFNNIGALLGLGKDITKPLEETIDGMLNNVFGKEKVNYVKLQFAKITTVFTAGVNILQSVRSSSATLGNAVETNANNTSRIGNALKSAGIIEEKAAWFDEQVRVNFDNNSTLGNLNNALNNVASVSSDLESITSEIKTAKEQLEAKDKEYEQKEKQKSEGLKKTEEQYTDKELPQVPNISAGDV